MVEIVQVLLEIRGKGLYSPDLERLKRDKKLALLGKELFMLYFSLNRIVTQGEL